MNAGSLAAGFPVLAIGTLMCPAPVASRPDWTSRGAEAVSRVDRPARLAAEILHE